MVAVRKDYAAPTELENLMIPIATNMPRLTALGTVGRAIPCPPPVANGRILVHEDGAHGVTRPTTARRRKRPPGRARSPAKSQLVAVRKHRPMAVWGGRTGGAHAPSRVVASALAGNIGRAERGSTRASNPTAEGGCAPHSKTGTGALPGQVPAGRPMAVWGGRTGGAHAPSRVVSSAPAGNIGRAERSSTRASNPTAGGGCAPHCWNHSVWETVFGATPETATGTGALPSNVPAGRPMAVWGGRTGQRAFEFQ